MGDWLHSYLHSAPLLALSALFIVLNVLAAAMRRKTVPLLGAAFGVIGCLMHPDLHGYAWLPVVLDLGTLKLITELPAIIRRERRFLPRERLAEFRLEEGNRKVVLELFASGACKLAFHFKPPARASGMESCGLAGRWKVGGGKRAGKRLFLQIDEGDPGRYEFTAEGDLKSLACVVEQHPLTTREPQASLADATLALTAGKLPKLNAARF